MSTPSYLNCCQRFDDKKWSIFRDCIPRSVHPMITSHIYKGCILYGGMKWRKLLCDGELENFFADYLYVECAEAMTVMIDLAASRFEMDKSEIRGILERWASKNSKARLLGYDLDRESGSVIIIRRTCMNAPMMNVD